MNFNNDLATIHAYLCADGYVIKNPENQKQKYYYIGFRNTNLILLKDFQEKFERYFGVKPRLIEGERCVIQNKRLYENLTKEFGSFYSWKWKMPKLNDRLSKIWLRAYFDCDGFVTCKSHQNRQIGADCVNEKGIKQIRKILKRLKINSKVKKRNTRNIFSLNIYGKGNLIRFKKLIGFLHPKKKEKLSQALEDFVNYYWKFPENKKDLKLFVKEIINRKGKIRKDNGIVRIISNKEENLLRLSKELKIIFKIESKLNQDINGIGTIYYELDINKRDEVKKLIKDDLLNNIEKEKWLKLSK